LNGCGTRAEVLPGPEPLFRDDKESMRGGDRNWAD
jgi:hypothetical protein